MVNANPKSDVAAKKAFVQELLRRGFDSASITKTPADITAMLNGQQHYFEIKYTTKNLYFGAPSLIEWKAALIHEDRYWFVVAAQRGGKWIFHEYTPAAFMVFNTIPPFKTYFSVFVREDRDTRLPKPGKGIRLTRERIAQMITLYDALKRGG
jgi:hypothetical protein